MIDWIDTQRAKKISFVDTIKREDGVVTVFVKTAEI